ncbi:MAG: FAD-dependent oxidoreductase [Acidobacteria bacterium]|nr:FAD-dependent oxidoreductase [Acidobacteriota bacterium]
MSDRFHPISMEQLTAWVFTELDKKNSLFGVPRSAIFTPNEADRFKLLKYGVRLDTPFGVAAGPQSQMAQNIVVSWLCGSRFLELKTVQTLDELDVNKPCIDIEDEGYNVEWSQELKVYESFDEYLRAWVLIHALHRKFGFPGDDPGMIFNMSVGYNMEGILKPNVQWFFEVMKDCSEYKQAYVDIVAEWCPEVREIEIPDIISDTITLSTMHGCPPDEIERICTYLLDERELHTSVKCNPTLLGPEKVRGIINEELGFGDVEIPDEAFGHDLEYQDAVPMLHSLRRLAREKGLVFGVKLTNTLEVKNFRDVFPDDDMMYLSGRALHAATTNLAQTLAEEFRGDLLMSFAGGADCFNVADLLRSGLTSITVCSDLLKSGGYLRMLQYFETLNAAMDEAGAVDLTDFVCKTGVSQSEFEEFAPMLAEAASEDSELALDGEASRLLAGRLADWRAGRAHQETAERATDVVRTWAVDRGFDADQAATLAGLVSRTLGRVNLRQYAAESRSEWRSKKDSFRTNRSKTSRPLGLFDCIEAPCVDECPVNQKVPQYMNAVRNGDFAGAVAITREDNPLPAILGRVCDHTCENTCIRTHYDEPLAIRDIKRFIMEQETKPELSERLLPSGNKVAIIGAGPAGLSAAQKLAFAGFDVTIFEMYPYAGGMVGGAIPEYRLPQDEIDQDVEFLKELGVDIRYGVKAGIDFTMAELRTDGFEFIFLAVGAQLAKRLNLPGEDSEGIMDALLFLRSVREEHPLPIGRRVGVIGAGDTAMDCVRSAYRLGSEVSLIYRRTIDQMPADREEIRGAIEEGIEIVEMAKPHALHIEGGKLAGLICTRMEYRGDRDSSGRKIPHEIAGSEFEIPLDTLILAISQHAILDFFGEEAPELSDRGYIRVNPETLESTLNGVYAGGDVAAHGPSSIVKASADGKLVADAIIGRVEKSAKVESGGSRSAQENEGTDGGADGSGNGHGDEFDLQQLMLRRAHRDWRVPVSHTPLDDRMNFNEPIQTYTQEEAMAEASRCLDCHEICSLCVGVCPNMALMTYESKPFTAVLPTLVVANEAVVLAETGATSEFKADQRYQIAVLTDFCNECGNCTTFCPTSGEPYRDKARLYLNREDFEAEKDNAFMLIRDSETPETDVIEARWNGETHRLEVNGDLRYTSPAFSARLKAADFSLITAQPGDCAQDGQVLSLEPCASMYVVLTGLSESMPHLPWASPASAHPGAPLSGTRVEHPGYEG